MTTWLRDTRETWIQNKWIEFKPLNSVCNGKTIPGQRWFHAVGHSEPDEVMCLRSRCFDEALLFIIYRFIVRAPPPPQSSIHTIVPPAGQLSFPHRPVSWSSCNHQLEHLWSPLCVCLSTSERGVSQPPPPPPPHTHRHPHWTSVRLQLYPGNQTNRGPMALSSWDKWKHVWRARHSAESHCGLSRHQDSTSGQDYLYCAHIYITFTFRAFGRH